MISHLKTENEHCLMRYGDYGDKYYIILKGSVGVYIPIKMTREMTLYELVVTVVEELDLSDYHLTMPGD